jgi:hypothetical protein
MDQLLASAIDSDICRPHRCQSPFYPLAYQKTHWIGDLPVNYSTAIGATARPEFRGRWVAKDWRRKSFQDI